MKLIDKDALVAWAKETYLCENASMVRKVCYKQLLEHLDTLEVKEVDLDKELDFVKDAYYYFTSDERSSMKKVARHFFELGIYSQLSWKDIRKIAEIGEEFMNSDESDNLNEKEYYIAILNKLKEKGRNHKTSRQ